MPLRRRNGPPLTVTREMLLQFVILFYFVQAALQLPTDSVCNDPEISDQCLTECRVNYLDCRSNCDSQICDSVCLADFQECEGSCPCRMNCPTGCIDCPEHSLCKDECEHAQLDNENYKICLNEAVNELEVCLKTCPPDIDCHNLCFASYTRNLLKCPCIENVTTTTMVTTTATTSTGIAPIEPVKDVFILVIGNLIDESYLASGDGSTKINSKINAPDNNYYEDAKHALINGKVHIFGGYPDDKKIARLDVCTLRELPARLNKERNGEHSALSVNDGNEALICFGSRSKTCEIFDGRAAVLTTFLSTWNHEQGGLGLYKSQPTTVGCDYNNFESYNKTETLTISGWSALPDLPIAIAHHSLVGLDNASMLLLGGQSVIGDDLVAGIWLLKNDQWNRIGELAEPAGYGSAIYIGRSIYFLALMEDSVENYWPIQRIDLNNEEEIQNVENIGHQGKYFRFPVLFQTSSDYCV